MKAYLQDLSSYTLDAMKKIWTTKRGASTLLTALAVVYAVTSLILGQARNPLWLVWWALSGSLVFSVSTAASRIYVRRLEKKLTEDISNPPGFKYLISTADGADVGEVDEVAYLKAKFTADTCFDTKALQAVNYVWIACSMVVRTLVLIPVVLVAAALAYPFFVTDNPLAEITLQQIIESNLLVITFQLTLMLVMIMSFIGGLKSAPGYKNSYELRLRKLLSKELPNIANSEGFTVTGYKIGCTSNGIDGRQD